MHVKRNPYSILRLSAVNSLVRPSHLSYGSCCRNWRTCGKWRLSARLIYSRSGCWRRMRFRVTRMGRLPVQQMQPGAMRTMVSHGGRFASKGDEPVGKPSRITAVGTPFCSAPAIVPSRRAAVAPVTRVRSVRFRGSFCRACWARRPIVSVCDRGGCVRARFFPPRVSCCRLHAPDGVRNTRARRHRGLHAGAGRMTG